MINFAICDDEPHMAEEIAEKLCLYMKEKQSVSFHIDTFPDGSSLLNSSRDFDLIFLDIRVPDMLGMDVARRIASGADILNVSGAAETPAIVRHIREQFPDVPIIATGGPTDETILETIHAGANAITYTPPTNGELFAQSMARYRRELDVEPAAER